MSVHIHRVQEQCLHPCLHTSVYSVSGICSCWCFHFICIFSGYLKDVLEMSFICTERQKPKVYIWNGEVFVICGSGRWWKLETGPSSPSAVVLALCHASFIATRRLEMIDANIYMAYIIYYIYIWIYTYIFLLFFCHKLMSTDHVQMREESSIKAIFEYFVIKNNLRLWLPFSFFKGLAGIFKGV